MKIFNLLIGVIKLIKLILINMIINIKNIIYIILSLKYFLKLINIKIEKIF